jgi:endonuclease YncB( thermonuclease family)
MRENIVTSTTKELVALALVLGFALCITQTAAAPRDGPPAPVSGLAHVIDGDTIIVNETRIRLEGIDAPEAGQTCKRQWVGSWPCGAVATSTLVDLVEGKMVSCEDKGLDKYGRTLGICTVAGVNVNAVMVRRGYAWAFVRYSSIFIKEEAEARAERIGIWQGEAIPAWEYRARRWAEVEQQTPDGCAIKGNITKHGRIYHMPWSPWYAQIRIEPEKGKRWFCTEAEALAAGWRPVQAH